MRIKPQAYRAYYYRGCAFDEQGNLDQAVVEFNRALAIEPGDSASLNGRAWVLYRKGEYDRSIEDATKAIDESLIPGDKWLYYHTRGAAYIAKGEREKAIADFQQALALEPDDPRYEREMCEYLQQHVT